MRTVIFETAIRLIIPLFIVFSVFLLFRGHNLPGGGFIGGLLASIGFFLHSMVFGVNETIRKYKLNPMGLMALGLAIAMISVTIPVFQGYPLMTGLWFDFTIPIIGKLGTPLLFDTGVYILVIGVVVNITFILSKF
ncbi:MAG TPA: Na+/H+ antiporter subunit B [Tenuifilaceae bacterium]|nr:Na+/H+ antiporter subunit B [Tenuifilaceae bacterium]HPE17370.1 Na+/H+ antiporter subunit B [Tenuifilaceae bacterium]HPJ45808.1 Na+/H+ antiporter subunit B [Tenuifilaceae bacterium]HPQ33523.1 Na+/H+ antiporter subunit B [Tenuifilaceae bacterium]HRX66844.1 Na+/H+ antiporter subunit B [Tenuifilaceae bacterium]